jgi:hypothetical protein
MYVCVAARVCMRIYSMSRFIYRIAHAPVTMASAALGRSTAAAPARSAASHGKNRTRAAPPCGAAAAVLDGRRACRNMHVIGLNTGGPCTQGIARVSRVPVQMWQG